MIALSLVDLSTEVTAAEVKDGDLYSIVVDTVWRASRRNEMSITQAWMRVSRLPHRCVISVTFVTRAAAAALAAASAVRSERSRHLHAYMTRSTMRNR